MNLPRVITLEAFQAELKMQKSPGRGHAVFKCPMCGTLQTANELIAAGAAADLEEVQKYVAFSCIGRFRPGSPSAFDHKAQKLKPGFGCDFTLGGLLPICHLMVQVPDEKSPRPVFAPASPSEAQSHWIKTGVIVPDGKAAA